MQDPIVFVVDDDEGVRSSLKTLMHASGLAVRCYDSAEDFLTAYDESWRGCVVLDIKMPGMSGIDMLKQMRHDARELPVIMVTGHGDIPACVETMKYGAIDFLEKPYQPRILLDSVKTAIQLDRDSWSKKHEARERKQRLELLTPEERHVLGGIGEGKLLKTIASELDVSLRTVQFRRTSIMEKLKLANRAQLVQTAALLH